MIDAKINNVQTKAAPGTTVLEAARQVGINIPTLCHLKMDGINITNKAEVCRVCMVDVAGCENSMPACTTEITAGMEVFTNTSRAVQARRANLERILANHPKDCLLCKRNLNCDLQKLSADMGIREVSNTGIRVKLPKDDSSHSIVRDMEKCILCHRCVTMCGEVQTVGVYSVAQHGSEEIIETACGNTLHETACTFCGQCVSVCPTGALVEIDNTANVWDAINDPDKYVVVQTAPSIRVSLGEAFGMPAGTQVTGKMVTALRSLGFDKVMDTAFGADVTVMEEASEFMHRLEHGGKLPIITSCCPAWVKFIEHQFPGLLYMPSSCRSPHQIFGSIAKTYLAEKLGVDPKKMVVVSVMPCLSKKYEAARDELSHQSYGRDVDYVISTRELARMIKESGIGFTALPDSDFDTLMGESTGAGVGFGTTGGVIVAVLRTVAAWLDGKPPEDINFTELRGLKGIREGTVTIGGKTINIGIAHGLGNARKLLEDVQSGKANYHAIEIMACPGGCIGGGGQPYHGSDMTIIAKRSKALRGVDEGKPRRMAHENAELQKLYDEFLGEPYGKKAHELLHTEFVKRG